MAKRLLKAATKEKQHYWQEKVFTWKKSGLSKTAFCRQHGLNLMQFSYWSLKHKKTPVSFPTIVPVNIKKAFIPLRAGPDSGLSLLVTCLRACLCVTARRQATHRQRGNYRIEVSNDFDPVTLKRVIQTVEGL